MLLGRLRRPWALRLLTQLVQVSPEALNLTGRKGARTHRRGAVQAGKAVKRKHTLETREQSPLGSGVLSWPSRTRGRNCRYSTRAFLRYSVRGFPSRHPAGSVAWTSGVTTGESFARLCRPSRPVRFGPVAGDFVLEAGRASDSLLRPRLPPRGSQAASGTVWLPALLPSRRGSRNGAPLRSRSAEICQIPRSE